MIEDKSKEEVNAQADSKESMESEKQRCYQVAYKHLAHAMDECEHQGQAVSMLAAMMMAASQMLAGISIEIKNEMLEQLMKDDSVIRNQLRDVE